MVESTIVQLESDSGSCRALQLMSSMCGCPAVEDHCRYCDEWEDEVPREYADRPLPLFPEYFGGDFGSEITCEEAFYSQYQFPSTDRRCYLGRLGSWECGCNGGSVIYLSADTVAKKMVLAWIPRVTGTLSILVSASGCFACCPENVTIPSTNVSLLNEGIAFHHCGCPLLPKWSGSQQDCVCYELCRHSSISRDVAPHIAKSEESGYLRCNGEHDILSSARRLCAVLGDGIALQPRIVDLLLFDPGKGVVRGQSTPHSVLASWHATCLRLGAGLWCYPILQERLCFLPY